MKRNSVKSARLVLLLVTGVSYCLLMAGCMSSDVCVVNASTGKVCELPCSGYRQWVVAVNDAASEFTTLTTRGYRAALRTYGYDGKLRRQRPCPPEFRNRSVYDGFSATRDAGLLVYWKDETGNLYVYDCKTGVETLVCERVASRSCWDSIKGLEWLSETKVLLLLNEDKAVGRRKPTIDVLDIATKKRQTVYMPNANIYEYALSPDNRKVAICDGEWEGSVVRVIDIKTGTAVAATDLERHYSVRWTLDGDAIGYEVRRKQIVVFSFDDNKKHVIHEMPEDQKCFVMVLLKNAFAYRSIPAVTPLRGPKTTPMYIHDLTTGKKKATVNEHFNGRWFVADGGKKIICEIGY